jgi:hypothetical protein
MGPDGDLGCVFVGLRRKFEDDSGRYENHGPACHVYVISNTFSEYTFGIFVHPIVADLNVVRLEKKKKKVKRRIGNGDDLITIFDGSHGVLGE